jgi:DNA-binding response OmpR family regulator
MGMTEAITHTPHEETQDRPQLLIADDNRQIVSILSEYGKKEGFAVRVAYDGLTALQVARARHFDMILLDVMMPGLDGFAVCREIRRESDVPIILVTARSEDFERIMGLEIGADDYIVKPFSPGEVMARIKAVLRRITPVCEQTAKRYTNGELTVDLDEYVTEINGKVIPLTKKEIEIIWTLATNPNKVFSRENLLQALWGYDYFGDVRTVDSHIKRLRAKLDAVDHGPWGIRTIRGVGYKFDPQAGRTDEKN